MATFRAHVRYLTAYRYGQLCSAMDLGLLLRMTTRLFIIGQPLHLDQRTPVLVYSGKNAVYQQFPDMDQAQCSNINLLGTEYISCNYSTL